MSALESYTRERNTSGAIYTVVISALARPTSAIFIVFSSVSFNGTRNDIQKSAITASRYFLISLRTKNGGAPETRLTFGLGSRILRNITNS